MKKIFYGCFFMILSIFFGMIFFPEKIEVFINKNIMNRSYRFDYNYFLRPFLESCIFEKSKLSCLLEVDGKPIDSGCFVNKSALENKIKKGLPQWAKNQIQEDLSHFPAITARDLDRYFNEKTDPHNIIVRIQVKGKKARISYASPYSFPQERMSYLHAGPVILNAIEYLAKNNYISDTDFILSLGDFHRPIGNERIPIFVFAKDLDIPIERNLVLIPDWQNLGSARNLRERIQLANNKISWENKENVMFWRGGKSDSTGFRQKFIDFSKQYPKLINTEFVKTYGEKEIKRFVEPEEHLSYKYLMSIDGQRASWERLVWHLHSNSLVFKHQTNQVQWFYKGIKPFVDYIPVRNEEDILKYMAWAEKHPNKVKSIIRHSSDFVEQNLSLEDMYHYMIILLEEYNKKVLK